MKKLFLTMLTMLPLMAMAQLTKNVTLSNAGELSKQIAQDEVNKITSLTVSGNLNGADLKLIQQIVNRTSAKEKNGEFLTTMLDLSGATILEGKEGMKLKANELPSKCFAGAKALLSVSLPSGLTAIGQNCFKDCKSLKEISIPSGVTTIGDGAFANCEDLAVDRKSVV